MASVKSQISGEIQKCKGEILALQDRTRSRKKDELQAQREAYAEGLATIFLRSFERIITKSKKKVVIITTAASGTWPSQDEPASASGLDIGA